MCRRAAVNTAISWPAFVYLSVRNNNWDTPGELWELVWISALVTVLVLGVATFLYEALWRVSVSRGVAAATRVGAESPPEDHSTRP